MIINRVIKDLIEQISLESKIYFHDNNMVILLSRKDYGECKNAFNYAQNVLESILKKNTSGNSSWMIDVENTDYNRYYAQYRFGENCQYHVRLAVVDHTYDYHHSMISFVFDVKLEHVFKMIIN